MSPPITQQKIELRKKIHDLLAQESDQSRHIAGLAIVEHLRDFIESFPTHLKSSGIAFFASLKDEIDTLPLDQYLQTQNIARLLPVVDLANNLMFQKIPEHLSIAELTKTHHYGISSPPAGSPFVASEKIGLFIVPGMAFDQRGNRLGRGKGYYDRFIHQQRKLNKDSIFIGIGLDIQNIESVPHDALDEHVNYICFPTAGFRDTTK